MLVCPKCKRPLSKQDKSYQCEHHHCFDIAKRGYVNLLMGNHKNSGDDKEMMRARTRFLSHGYYENLQTKVIDILKELHITTLVDAGCGEGYYTNQIKKALPNCDLFGFDLSKYGVDEASKAHNGVFYGVANVFHLPLQEACAQGVLSIFAPFDEAEMNRILRQNGYFLKIGPGPKHLLDLKKIVYEDVYENERSERLTNDFEFVREVFVEYEIEVHGQEDIWALFQMTPYYWKSPKEGSNQLRSLLALNTYVQFHIEVYKKK